MRYLQLGLTDKEAKGRALAEVKGYLTARSSPSVRSLSAPSEQNGHQPNERMDSVKAFLTENPETAQLSINQVLAVVNEAGIKVGRTTVAEVLQEHKNGTKLSA